MSLNKFLNPKSIAIIGASNNFKKLGYQILNNLIKGGFNGNIYPINLKEKKILGYKVYESILDIKDKIDLAVIVVPAKIAVLEVKKCAIAKIKNIVIISANFSETSKEGAKLEEEIQRMGKKNNINILGPNCLGFINHLKGINITFAKTSGSNIFHKIKKITNKNNIAFISQSGAVGSAVLDWSLGRNINFSYFISLGNKAVMNENDFFKYLKNDKSTGLYIAYLEEIEKGEEFLSIISSFPKNKRVAVLKSGQSRAGQAAAFSHTGSMAGSHEACLAGFKRAGVIALNSLEDGFNLIKLCQRNTQPKNNHLFIVSNAGGPMVVATDLASRKNIKLGNFSKQTILKIKKTIPELNTIKNPFDILGDAGAKRYQKSLEIILKDSNVFNLLILLTPQTSTQILKTVQVIVKLGKKYKNKMICASFIGGKSLDKAKEILNNNNIPCFDYPGQAINAISFYLKGFNFEKKPYLPAKKISNIYSNEVIQEDYIKGLKLLKKYNIPIVQTKKINNIKELKGIKYPAVLKLVGKKIIHKTDQNLIKLNLKNYSEAKEAFKKFNKFLKDNSNYCVSQEMKKEGEELIVGFKRDDSFGPIIIVGTGGIYTEFFKDIQREVSDVDIKRAKEMIKNLKIYPILKGARGKFALDIQALANTIVKVARIARENPEIKELDINPLFINKKGVVAADARVIKLKKYYNDNQKNF